MSTLRSRVAPRPSRLQLAWLAGLMLVSGSVPAQQSATDRSYRPLDGLRFETRIVREGNDEGAEPLTDELLFQDGNFSSAVCKRYNFAAAPYWMRIDGDRVRFLAELTSPTDGTMLWTGTIKDDVLEGTMRWTKERWYWTIDAEHRIRGKLSKVTRATD